MDNNNNNIMIFIIVDLFSIKRVDVSCLLFGFSRSYLRVHVMIFL